MTLENFKKKARKETKYNNKTKHIKIELCLILYCNLYILRITKLYRLLFKNGDLGTFKEHGHYLQISRPTINADIHKVSFLLSTFP